MVLSPRYLSVDMQMFLVGPPIILLLYTLSRRKSPVLFYSVGLLVSLIAILIPGILTWVYNFGPTDVLQVSIFKSNKYK